MAATSATIDDLLRHPLQFGWYRVADAPVRYRALELGDTRFAWTVPPFLRPRAAGSMVPMHYAMTLRLSAQGDWRVLEIKAFEWAEHAERWARGLWRDAVGHRFGHAPSTDAPAEDAPAEDAPD